MERKCISSAPCSPWSPFAAAVMLTKSWSLDSPVRLHTGARQHWLRSHSEDKEQNPLGEDITRSDLSLPKHKRPLTLARNDRLHLLGIINEDTSRFVQHRETGFSITNVNYRSFHLSAAWLSKVPHHTRRQQTVSGKSTINATVDVYIARMKKEKVAMRVPPSVVSPPFTAPDCG